MLVFVSWKARRSAGKTPSWTCFKKRKGMSRTALALAFSPTAWPPMPSATTKTCPCAAYPGASEAGWAAHASWLWLRFTPTSVRAAYRTGSNAATGPPYATPAMPSILAHPCEIVPDRIRPESAIDPEFKLRYGGNLTIVAPNPRESEKGSHAAIRSMGARRGRAGARRLHRLRRRQSPFRHRIERSECPGIYRQPAGRRRPGPCRLRILRLLQHRSGESGLRAGEAPRPRPAAVVRLPAARL